MDTPSELLNIKLPPDFCSIPFGLHLIGNMPEKVVLITWNHNMVVTYKFRNISVEFLAKSLDNFNALEPSEVHEIKNFLEPNETIANIFDTLLNTFLTTSFGRLFIFVSSKIIRQLHLSVSNKIFVKNLGFTASSLYLIENQNSKELFIKLYANDIIQDCDTAVLEPLNEYNLNFDDNLKFNIGRLDEMTCIKVYKFDENLRNILEGLIGAQLDETIKYIDIVLFSIESNLFWLNTYNADNAIQPLNVSASTLTSFSYSKNEKCIICLLESGVVEILYYATQFKMIDKYYHPLGVHLECYKFIDANSLIYSNDRRLVQISFYNDRKDCDGIDIETKTINVFGCQAIAYNAQLKQMFVITNNFQLFNIGYTTIYFELSPNTNTYSNFNLNEIKNFSKILFHKSETIKNLENRKNSEINKIQLIDLVKLLKSDRSRRIHDTNTCRIKLVYRQNMCLQFVFTFNVHLKIVDNAKHFKIMIEQQKFDHNAMHTFDVERKIMFHKTIECDLDRLNFDFIMPKFKIALVSRLSMANDSIAFEFPVKILNNYFDDITQHFFYLNYNRTLDDNETVPFMSVYKFRIENDGVGLEELINHLNLEYEEGLSEYLFLNHFKFTLKFVEGLVTIESECPQTLFCVKYYIVKRLNPSVEFKEGTLDSVQKLKYSLPEDDQITVESQAELRATLENLRNEFIPLFKIPPKIS